MPISYDFQNNLGDILLDFRDFLKVQFSKLLRILGRIT